MNWLQRHDEDLISQVQGAIRQLEADGLPIEQRRICSLLGYTQSLFTRSIRLRAFWQQYQSERLITHLHQEQKYIVQLQELIEKCQGWNYARLL
jgi:hypothetical protein